MIDLSRVPRRRATLLVGIDGAGGSGKSTVAAALSDKVVHTDDFIRKAWGWYDLERLRREVVEPLSRDRRARYRRYSWEEDRLLDDWVELEPGGVVVVEGVAALDLRLRDLYDYRVWVETPREIWWEAWAEKERRYWDEQRPCDAADAVVDGSGG